jgi:hypothetical protein
VTYPDPDGDADVRDLEAGPPIDWTLSYDRFPWMCALRNHIYQIVCATDEPSIARRILDDYECTHRLLALVGFPRETWMSVPLPSPPWRCPEPPPIPRRGITLPDAYAPWPPLDWTSPIDRERWYWRLDGLCEHLAALALHILGDRDHPLRLRVEWTLTRLRSHLANARPRLSHLDPAIELREVPPLAFWVGWPRMQEHLER